jgi:hypothetical protein
MTGRRDAYSLYIWWPQSVSCKNMVSSSWIVILGYVWKCCIQNFHERSKTQHIWNLFFIYKTWGTNEAILFCSVSHIQSDEMGVSFVHAQDVKLSTAWHLRVMNVKFQILPTRWQHCADQQKEFFSSSPNAECHSKFRVFSDVDWTQTV